MTPPILGRTRFQEFDYGWANPSWETPGFHRSSEGITLSPSSHQPLDLDGSGVHTRNGDSIALRFKVMEGDAGSLRFGFDAAGHEHAMVELDFASATLSLFTTDWRLPQPVASAGLSLNAGASHELLIEKRESGHGLIKSADVRVYLDGETCLTVPDLDLLPEMGVKIAVADTTLLVQEFVHRGTPSDIPEYLHVGGWQMLNVESIEANLDSLCRGLVKAAEEGIDLLVTPETSLTGLFPCSPVTTEPALIAAAETLLR